MKNKSSLDHPVPPEILNPDSILTIKEVAARLKVPEEWVYSKTRRRCSNPIPAVNLGRCPRFSWSDVARWFEAQKTVKS